MCRAMCRAIRFVCTGWSQAVSSQTAGVPTLTSLDGHADPCRTSRLILPPSRICQVLAGELEGSCSWNFSIYSWQVSSAQASACQRRSFFNFFPLRLPETSSWDDLESLMLLISICWQVSYVKVSKCTTFQVWRSEARRSWDALQKGWWSRTRPVKERAFNKWLVRGQHRGQGHLWASLPLINLKNQYDSWR